MQSLALIRHVIWSQVEKTSEASLSHSRFDNHTRVFRLLKGSLMSLKTIHLTKLSNEDTEYYTTGRAGILSTFTLGVLSVPQSTVYVLSEILPVKTF